MSVAQINFSSTHAVEQALLDALHAVDKAQPPRPLSGDSHIPYYIFPNRNRATLRKNRMFPDLQGNIGKGIDVVEQVLANNAWPTEKNSRAEEARRSAYMILLQGDDPQNHARRRDLMPQIEDLHARGEIHPVWVASLRDRVNLHDGKDQVYGTQIFEGRSGKRAYYPIEDTAKCDERRAEVGLGKLGRDAYHTRAHLPAGYLASQRISISSRMNANTPVSSGRLTEPEYHRVFQTGHAA